jgi:hypothetical protein
MRKHGNSFLLADAFFHGSTQHATQKCRSISSVPGAVEYARRMSMKDESAALKHIRSENLRNQKNQDRSIFPEQAKWMAQLLLSMNAKKVCQNL